ncbi:arylamine N-acetyltransferase [Mesobaculum littorinae]|uniref:Arylamine N-acetyltransferase n=1 Tax=Mesobaculum littorinae TaxID=2486419 RepID=A0A438ALV3_9RHOB|nr:arylamine N-acetyltransferase [Mesobaculum littorinae]RVV99630.1 arylamine N-acetyltransferase [Mesobaculum littorinae]
MCDAMSEIDLQAYLTRLGLSAVASDADGLARLQTAQMRMIVFENIDPLLGRTPSLKASALRDKLIRRKRGGYCFEQNALLGQALLALGFSIVPVLGRVRMGRPTRGPRTHAAWLVTCSGTRWLVDAGFGGPGSLVPLRLDTDRDQVAPNGIYRLTWDAVGGEHVVERQTPDGWLQLYGFDEVHVAQIDLRAANHLCATWHEQPFSTHLFVAGWSGDTRIGIFDRAITREGSETTKSRIPDRDHLAEVLCDQLAMPLTPEEITEIWAKIAG